jgi:hypothetical protein
MAWRHHSLKAGLPDTGECAGLSGMHRRRVRFGRDGTAHTRAWLGAEPDVWRELFSQHRDIQVMFAAGVTIHGPSDRVTDS